MSTPPLPLGNENDIEFKGIKFNKNEIYEYESNNHKYKLKISNNETIIYFEIEEINHFPKKDFNIHLNLEQLCKISTFFLQFENLNEISETFKQLIEKKSIKIEKKEKEIALTIINPINMKEFNMSIPLKEKDIKSEVNSLNSYVFKLNEKIEKLEKRVNYLENELNDYKRKVNEIYEIKNEYEVLKKKEINNYVNMFDKSSIIKREEQELILSWMEKKPKKFKLLLDSNIDGDSNSTFYNKCGKKYPTIVFIKTTNDYRFGGYTSQTWPSNLNYGKDEKSFMFSLDLKSKYRCIKYEKAIWYDTSFFSFGNNLYIYNKCTQNKISNLGFPFSYDIPKNNELNGGKNNFTVKSYEVYEVEY